MAGDANIESFVSSEEPNSEEECLQKYGDLSDQGSTLCPPAWDSFFCWPPTEAGSIVSFPCHRIFPFLQQATHSRQVAVAYRRCNEDGFWSEGKWTNYTECQKLEIRVEEHPISPLTISYVIFVGSIVSLVSLLITLFIFCYFKTLQCSRIRVHKNLVLSLILHAVMMLAISLPGIFPSVDHVFKETDWLCKGVLVLKMYSAMTCIHWMFVEGLLLHSSITVSVFQREPPFRLYYAIGWGIPLMCVGTWLLLMSFNSSSPCWRGYGLSPFVWFITGPMILALVVNAVFLVNIIRILVTKLRTSVSIETKQVKKAMKATALLFPLLGITHLLFCINPRDDADLEHIYMLVNALLQSSQGVFVAVLYCFLNSEVARLVSILAAATLLVATSCGAFQSLPLQYVLLGCKGNNNLRHMARLSRVCEDCYALYKDQEIPVTCRENCFNNGVFSQCVQSIAKEHLIEELLVLAQEIGQKGVGGE